MAKPAVFINRADVTRYVRETLVHGNDDFDIPAIVDDIIKLWPEVIGLHRFSTTNSGSCHGDPR